MKPLKLVLVVGTLAAAAVALTSCERKVTNEYTNIVPAGSAKYIGSDKCQPCHSAIYTDFRKTGHPFKLNKAAEAKNAGYYPFRNLEGPPAGYTWDQVSYVIGGFWWKARFIDLNGKIITGDASATTQYNLPTNEASTAQWVPYNAGKDLDYNCGPCHMTAYDSAGHQGGLPGMIGTWALDGIQCEECHGAGEFHVDEPKSFAMKIDRTNQACGKCHVRGSISSIPAKGGFVDHHEQWNEMSASKHAALQCVTCHNPHKGLHELNPDRAAAITNKCENCHFEQAAAYTESGQPHYGLNVKCIDCHMAKTGKSARKSGPYKGDIHSHAFAINTDSNAKMFNADSTKANSYITLDFACLQCHATETKQWAATHAAAVHPEESGSERATCFTCHGDQNFDLVAARQQWENSIHASGNNINRNRNYAPQYQTCEKCHTSEGFIAALTGVPASGEYFTAIGCFTCHEPHTNGNLNVRVSGPTVLADGTVFDREEANLCVRCHQSRTDIRTLADPTKLTTRFGPHYGNQGDMLVGAGGYEYSGYEYKSSAHTAVATEGCINCHMTGTQANLVGGHSFNMHNEEHGLQNLAGCNVQPCHGATGALTSLNRTSDEDFDEDGTKEGVQDEIDGLVEELGNTLLAAGLVDTLFRPKNNLVTGKDSAGAVYNYKFVEEDRSEGIHNTEYAAGLLKSSINYITTGNPSGVSPRQKGGLMAAH